MPSGGVVAPGRSPGIMTISGNFNPGNRASLEIEIGGPEAGSGFDRVEVAGTSALDGDLELSLIDTGEGVFFPASSDTLTVLTTVALFGAFDNVASGERLQTADGLGSFLVEYSEATDEVVLSDFRAKIPGDYNEDGIVNIVDYAVWRDVVGAPAGRLPNDVDGGFIGAAQYDTWKANFGRTTPPTGARASFVVPEPPSILILLCTLGSLLSRRRDCEHPLAGGWRGRRGYNFREPVS